jgi:MFS family permease
MAPSYSSLNSIPKASSRKTPKRMYDEKTPTQRPKSFYITISCLCICVFIATVNTVIVASALPAIASALNATTTQAYWCGTVLVFAQCITQPIYGAFAEALGRKVCLVAALGIFALASLLGATARSIEWLIAARVVRPYPKSCKFRRQILIEMLTAGSRNGWRRHQRPC